MMSPRLPVEFLSVVEISSPRTLLRIVVVVALIVDLGRLVLMYMMMYIGSSQVAVIGIELPNPRLPATSYSYWCLKEMERKCWPTVGYALWLTP